MIVSMNGVSVSRARVPLSLQGAWRAEIELVADKVDGLAGPAILTIGETDLVGTATAAVDAGGRVTAVLRAGAGALDSEVQKRGFASVTRRLVLQDTLNAVGERLSPDALDQRLFFELGHWTRLAGPAGQTVRAIATHLGVSWRHLLDGTVWLGPETWPDANPSHVLESETPTAKRFVVALEGATVLPGTTFRGQRVSSVDYMVTPSSIRAAVSYDETRAPLMASQAELTRREVAHLDLSQVFLCKVVGQNGDESLELQSTDPRLPDLSRVLMRPGIIGVTSQIVPTGVLTIVTHENGDPSKPAVIGFASGSATEVTLDAAIVKIGKLATSMIARADLVDAELAAFSADYHAHTHPVAGALASASTTATYSPSSVAASKGMVE